MLYDKRWDRKVETAPTEPWRGLLLDAANLLRERGLAKGTQLSEKGEVCLHGAIRFTRWGVPSYEEYWSKDFACRRTDATICRAENAVRDYLRRNGVSSNLAAEHGCAGWNNERERTQDEVIAALEGAASS